MEINKIDDFFKVLEKFQKEQIKTKEIIIPIFKNDKGKYNIYYGILKPAIDDYAYKDSIFKTEKEFLKSGYKKILTEGNCVCLEDVEEKDLYKIIFAFNMKYFTKSSFSPRESISAYLEKFSSDDKIFPSNLKVSIVFAKNIIDSKILKSHYEGVEFNEKFKQNELLDKYYEKENIMNYYSKEYKYYLEILNQFEKSKASFPIKMAYIFANYENKDSYYESQKTKEEEKEIGLININNYIKNKTNKST